MKKFSLLIATALTCTLFSSCVTTTDLYSWYNYEDLAYTYQKKSTDEAQAKLLKEYEKMDKKQKATRKVVPPGFKAEYGYLLYKIGKPEEGLQLLKEEISLYPESEEYIGRIVKQLEK